MADTKTTQTAAAKPAPKPKSKDDLARLDRLAAEIAGWPGDRLAHLAAQLEGREGLKLTETKKGSGLWVASMAGLRTKPGPDRVRALENWANAARREVLRGGGPA